MRFRISASQLKLFHPEAGGCPRKWAMHYLARVPKIGGPALEDGILVHECIDDLHSLSSAEWMAKWPSTYTRLQVGEEARRAKYAQLAIAMARLSPPGKSKAVSEPTYFHDDAESETSFYIKPDLHRDEAVFVDWKTTSALTRQSPWALQLPSFWEGEPPKHILKFDRMHRVRMLGHDIQANLYAYGLMTRWGTSEVTALWVYGCKKFGPGERPKVWPVERSFRLAEVRDYFTDVVRPTARAMNTIRDAWERGILDTPLLVPYYGESCEFIGKFCDALGHCGFKDTPIPMSKLRLPVLPD